MKWYNKSWIMWVCLIFFTPMGLILLYTNRERHPKWKIIAGCSIAWFIIALSSPSHKVPQETPAPKQEIAQQEQQPTQIPLASKEIDVQLNYTVTNVGGKYKVSCETNLPDGMELMVTLDNSDTVAAKYGITAKGEKLTDAEFKTLMDNSYNGQGTSKVENGKFEVTFSGDNLLPGEYKLTISSTLAKLQKDASVKEKLGNNGANLKGKYVVDTSDGNKLIRLEEKVSLK